MRSEKIKSGLKISKKAKEYLYELSKRTVKVIDFGEAIFMPQKKKYIDFLMKQVKSIYIILV